VAPSLQEEQQSFSQWLQEQEEQAGEAHHVKLLTGLQAHR